MDDLQTLIIKDNEKEVTHNPRGKPNRIFYESKSNSTYMDELDESDEDLFKKYVTCDICKQRVITDHLRTIMNTYAIAGSTQGSVVWAALRSSGQILTASRVHKITNPSLFMGDEESLLYECNDAYPVRMENENTIWGCAKEKYARRLFIKFTGHFPIPNLPLCVNKEVLDGKCGASPDGVTYCEKLLEFKCPRTRKITKGTKIPDYYIPQVQFSLEILGLESCFFFQYDATCKKCCLDIVKRDKEWFKRNYENFDFWTNRSRLFSACTKSQNILKLFEDVEESGGIIEL